MTIGHRQRFSQAVFSPDGTRTAFLVGTVDYRTHVPARLVTVKPDGSQAAIGPPINLYATEGPNDPIGYSLSWQPLR